MQASVIVNAKPCRSRSRPDLWRASGIVLGCLAAFAAGPAAAQAVDSAAHPNFSGIWFPAGRGTRTPDPLPFTEGAAQLEAEYEEQFSGADPGRYCIWPGMPRAPWGAPFPIEVFHRPQDLTIFWEGYGMYRKVYMADHNPPDPILPTAMGHSVAHWEGETLVIETSQLRPYPYMNRFPTTSDARVTERMRLEHRDVDGERKTFLVDELTVVDPKLYTEPVDVRVEAELRPDLQMLEYTCTTSLWEDFLLEQGLTLPDVDALPDPTEP
jgi:hypothetical protein